MRIKHVTVPVKNQDVALEFYTKKLGFELVCDMPWQGGQRWIELKIPGGETQLVLFTPAGSEDRIGTFNPIVFETENLDKTYESLCKKGVEFTCPPTKESWGSYTLFKDPDGNTFCLSQPSYEKCESACSS